MIEIIIQGAQWLVGTLVAVLLLIVAIRGFKSYFAPVKTVKAEVVAKNKVESFSKYAPNGKHCRYCVVFQAEKKKLSFYVSEFSYGGYRIHEKGTLKYKGNRIINFH